MTGVLENLDGTLRYVSPSCERISGYEPEAFIRRPELFREIIVPEDRDLWDGHDCDALEKPGTRERQFRVKRPDGTIRWIEHVCQPVTDSAGKYIGIRASNRDITLRKQAEGPGTTAPGESGPGRPDSYPQRTYRLPGLIR